MLAGNAQDPLFQMFMRTDLMQQEAAALLSMAGKAVQAEAKDKELGGSLEQDARGTSRKRAASPLADRPGKKAKTDDASGQADLQISAPEGKPQAAKSAAVSQKTGARSGKRGDTSLHAASSRTAQRAHAPAPKGKAGPPTLSASAPGKSPLSRVTGMEGHSSAQEQSADQPGLMAPATGKLAQADRYCKHPCHAHPSAWPLHEHVCTAQLGAPSMKASLALVLP